jgi:lipid A 3-O-deacylase
MMKCPLWLSVCVIALGIDANAAGADVVRDIRFGLVKHNLFDDRHREQSENVEGEVVFNSPPALKFIGRPRPYAMVSVNDQGFTDFAAVGLYWRKHLSAHWLIEPGVGLAVHDGRLDNPYPAGDPRNAGYGDSRVLLGTRELFRTTLALERELGPHLGAQIYIEHLSNGGILGSERNQGLNEVGLRVAWRFRSND